MKGLEKGEQAGFYGFPTILLRQMMNDQVQCYQIFDEAGLSNLAREIGGDLPNADFTDGGQCVGAILVKSKCLRFLAGAQQVQTFLQTELRENLPLARLIAKAAERMGWKVEVPNHIVLAYKKFLKRRLEAGTLNALQFRKALAEANRKN